MLLRAKFAVSILTCAIALVAAPIASAESFDAMGFPIERASATLVEKVVNRRGIRPLRILGFHSEGAGVVKAYLMFTDDGEIAAGPLVLFS